MKRRKVIIAVIVATVGLGVAALPAAAELHSVTVVLVTGQRITKTVDIAPGTPASQIVVPGITGAIAQIIDNGPINVPTPTGTPLPAPTVPAVPTVPGEKPKPKATPTPDGNDRPGAPNRSQGGSGQAGSGQPTRNKKFKAGNLNSKKLVSELKRQAKKKAAGKVPGRALDGTPTLDNPTFSLAQPGAAPIGVPNFFIDKFRIPPFLLPLYQAAGIEYGVRWEVLAAINEIETDYGRNLNVSSAGALGWMQFMPSTWKQYGVDANKDGFKDPYSPPDAIFAAARYLKAAGAEQDLRKAVFAYNHADWYVDSVLMRARLIGGLPSNFVGSLTGLTQGHFPVAAKATYADDFTEADAKKAKKRSRKLGNRALVVQGSQHRRGIKIFARRGAPVVAVNDGKIVRVGENKRLGKFVELQDTYGNTYTYARLKKVSKNYPAPRLRTTTQKQVAKELALPAMDAAPTAPASSTTKKATKRKASKQPNRHVARGKTVKPATPAPAITTKQRLFAHPQRPNAGRAGGKQQEFERTGKIDGSAGFKSYFSKVFGLDRKDVRIKRLRPGARVVAGTVLGRIGKVDAVKAPHMLFEIRPAGRGAPRIDPKPILDGWKLLESTAIYRAAGKNPFFGPDAKQPTIGQILLMSKEALVQHVLANPRAGDARGPRRLRPAAHGLDAQVRPLALHDVRQHLPALVGQRGRHRQDQRHPDRRAPGQGLDHRADRAAAADPAGHDEARPDHHADDVRRRGQHARDGRPLRPHPRRLEAAVRDEQQGCQAGQRGAEAQAVDQADRPARDDRQPGGQPAAVEARAEGHRARLRGAPRRVKGAAASRRFSFVQWEFAGRLGPEAGRYVVRRYAGDDPRHVVVIGELEAPRRRRLGARRRPRSAAAGSVPDAVDVTRATVIATDPITDDGAHRWLEEAVKERDKTVGDALALLNRAIHGHRLAAADPYVGEVSEAMAMATRIGYGSGEQVADGDWEEARELPPPELKRSMLLTPQQRLAALLAGRDVALACEDLALRARLDLDQGRGREAALQLSLAMDAAFAELEGWRASEAVATRLDKLHEHREPVVSAAAAALQGGLQPEQTEAVEAALQRLEAALRARLAEL
jgi:murein DD-endopeptidase MepM/ murein hydrolase activator NlpD